MIIKGTDDLNQDLQLLLQQAKSMHPIMQMIECTRKTMVNEIDGFFRDITSESNVPKLEITVEVKETNVVKRREIQHSALEILVIPQPPPNGGPDQNRQTFTAEFGISNYVLIRFDVTQNGGDTELWLGGLIHGCQGKYRFLLEIGSVKVGDWQEAQPFASITMQQRIDWFATGTDVTSKRRGKMYLVKQ